MSEAAATQRPYKAAPVSVDLLKLAGVLKDFGLGTPLAVAELPGGGAWSFRVDRIKGPPLVLKAFDDAHPHATGKETYASRLLRDLDVPMTRFVASDESRTRLPFRYTIANYLPGRQVMTFKDEPDVADLYRQMGAMLRKLHTVRVDGYGSFGADGVVNPAATNAEFVDRFFLHGFDRFRHYGGGEALAQQLEAIVADHADIVAHSRGAVFAHDDFQPNNVLAERDARGRLQLTGLLDFGNAKASDPVCDLAKALFCSEHDAPGSGPAIREGYGLIDHPDPDAALWIYLLLHRLTMWWWLRHVGVIREGERHDLIVDLEAMAAQKRA
ncbi:MAG: aminoglycoside phosphotransferase family protein [Devosia sp.]|uniref:phosphotransferase family protein n=1 Tax=Devosia sp. TaxID=1871048 RepID=UPI001AC8232B|nr:aminoglycoside phosphotransferase family protein [Devosia sp.]MBN9314611.1 aminoglycoside phosphotransferase family protein [Devosia sp.]